MPSLLLTNLTDILQARVSGDLAGRSFSSVSIDSRTIEAGELFWAIEGPHHDGHNYLAEAERQGAVAAVVSRVIDDLHIPQIIVEETTAALGRFARWHRDQQPGIVIGVTGSVGKTTARHMLHGLLSHKYSGIQSPFNFNNQVGVPLSLLQMQPEHEFAVIELAASAPGEIRELGSITRHEVAWITSIAEAHLEGFGSIDQILTSKAELLETLDEGGFAVLNGDDARLYELSKTLSCPVLLYGRGHQNHFQATIVNREPSGWNFEVNGELFFLPAVNPALISTAAGAIAIATELGMDIDEIRTGLRHFTPPSSRCELKTIGPWTVIDDTYNASPLSVRAACQTLTDWTTPHRKFLILGDMLELGLDAKRLHSETASAIGSAGIDYLIAHGEFSAEVASKAARSGTAPHQIADCPTLETIDFTLDCWLQPGDVILVKGSRGMRMERIISWLEQRAAELQQETKTHQARPRRAAA
ncbi:MAG TPA: UDP-N-acetylmuramoyl-tripeptide--D-alanyl-D-alanine ligase [Planctomycetaceae bacterium]|nr:UDP-N-acetylmuramoyl-tripeptide--D-alanyl-D-alanine ligase [Planctomycetaceae bacterium]